MTDKVQLIKEEIERLYKHYIDAQEFDSGYNMALDDILKFINSLPEEPASEDLKKELNKYVLSKFTIDKEILDRFGIKPEDYTFSLDKKDLTDVAHHFAEWQKKKDQETIELAEDHALLVGMMKEREEMMKNAISCNVDWYDGFRLDYTQEQQDDILLKLGADVGDKVKIIIVKEEQQ